MRRHIVLIAPPWYPIPVYGYGGIELVVTLLAAGLRARGHRVTMFAAEGSCLPAHVAAPRAWSADLGGPDQHLRLLTYAAAVLRALASLGPVDLIHDHCGGCMLLGAALLRRAPVVHTVHGPLPEPESTYYRALHAEAGLVAISGSQRRSADLAWLGMVHNAADVAALRIGRREDKEPYLVCLARICSDKGQRLAIEVARRTGLRLVMAGKVETTEEGREYYRRHVAPAIDGDRVVHLDNVGGEEKARLLARATAMIAPLQWEEPFGLAMVEAMASGTPVVALARGAAPELITPGQTGFLADQIGGLVDGVTRIEEIDPRLCAETARRRFGPAAMVEGYLAVYARAMAGQRLAVLPPVREDDTAVAG
ncbi:MAG TPA: glycosyltransferase family 4 protein [Candidatus Dormibacteraeota bacterium]|nr:glycosyltransferase family 4 protein [Candidatus Dormibacteraeota bacterium]